MYNKNFHMNFNPFKKVNSFSILYSYNIAIYFIKIPFYEKLKIVIKKLSELKL